MIEPEPVPCRWEDGSLILTTRVRPNAGRAELAIHGDVLRLSVQCPPVEGRANGAAIAVLAKAFRVPKQSVRLLSGEHYRIKRFRIHQPRWLPGAVQALLLTSK